MECPTAVSSSTAASTGAGGGNRLASANSRILAMISSSLHTVTATRVGGTTDSVPCLDGAGAGVFFLTEDEEIPAHDEDYSAFARPPVQGLIVGAAYSGPTNHRLLGHLALALALALRLGALIDFDGLLTSPPASGAGSGDADVLDRARPLASARPGSPTEVSYDTGGGGRYYRHVGDVEFLEAWLRHPYFHLVK